MDSIRHIINSPRITARRREWKPPKASKIIDTRKAKVAEKEELK